MAGLRRPGLTSGPFRTSYSGATAPDFHRLPNVVAAHFTSERIYGRSKFLKLAGRSHDPWFELGAGLSDHIDEAGSRTWHKRGHRHGGTFQRKVDGRRARCSSVEAALNAM